MLEIKKCPICEQGSFSSFLETKDYMITKEPFTIVSCDNCGFHFTNPVPEESAVAKYYQDEAYVSHSSSNKGIINAIYNKVRNITLNQKANWIKKFSSESTLLDIGSGTGHFLSKMKSLDYNVHGLEPDPIARKNAKAINGVNTDDISKLKELKENQFDVITMWHVLEHVYDLKKNIKHYKRLLKENGVIFIAVPNLSSYDAKYYKKYWAAYDVPRHLYHFTEKDIVSLFSDMGFKHQATLPMKFDSYYVSMLSEKYKKGNLLNAIRIGFLSNLKAKNFGFSSQVYVLKLKSK